MKLLHVADVHLDAPFRWLGAKGQEQRQQLKAAFRAIIDLALQEKVDALLVAGDLFDSNSPSQDSIDLVRAQFQRLVSPVFVLPGTHDCLDGNSVYRKADLTGANIHLFDRTSTVFELSGLGLTVHGRANTTKTSSASPLQGLTANAHTRFNVALAHGSLAMPGTEHDFPIAREDIAGSRMDYLALGHWHSYQDCSAAGSPAFYSGPPELLAEGQRGCALLVELSESGVRVEPRDLGKRRFEKLELALDQVRSVGEMGERLRSLADPQLFLSVRLTGLRPLDLTFDPAELVAELEADFFALRLSDASHPVMSSEDMEQFPNQTVLGQFVRQMIARVDEATTPQQRRVAEKALQVGVALLQGKKVL